MRYEQVDQIQNYSKAALPNHQRLNFAEKNFQEIKIYSLGNRKKARASLHLPDVQLP